MCVYVFYMDFTWISNACLWFYVFYMDLTWIHSFIHSGYLYSAPSRNLLRGALSPATVKEKCLEKLAERRHVVPRQQAQCKRELMDMQCVYVLLYISYGFYMYMQCVYVLVRSRTSNAFLNL